jgi:hypothetical protein
MSENGKAIEDMHTDTPMATIDKDCCVCFGDVRKPLSSEAAFLL